MSQFSPFFNRWLSQVSPDQAFEVLTDLIDIGAIFAIDATGKILFWSKGAEKLFGLSMEQVIGKSCTEALSCDEEHDPCGLAHQGAIKGQLIRLRCPDGKPLLVYRTARAFFDAGGQFNGAIEYLQPQQLDVAIRKDEEDSESFHGILTRDPLMKEAIKVIRNVAETEATILIRGESGTGKELVAHALHMNSSRRNQCFLAINCAALSANLLESELFGHVKGAFTGAVRNHAGLFQRANGGTLFLDEIAELPLELQAKLLRVLQEKNFIPVGGDTSISVDVRIIAATHRSLREEVKSGNFREDLMYRLRVVPIFLPPLRERRMDISLLLWHNIAQHNLKGLRHIDSIDEKALRCLLNYDWPGNVRELKNVVEYAFAIGRGNELRTTDLPPEFSETIVPKPSSPARHPALKKQVDEEKTIREALQIAHGHIETAAHYAGMSRATFWRKRKKYHL